MENGIVITLVFVLGSILGSFIGMASWRWPRKESWGGRSHCVACGRTLGVSDLIPILSYFLKKRKCTCGVAISSRYPIIEFSTGILCAIIVARFGTSIMLFLTAFLAAYIVERMNETESLGGGDLKLLFAAGPWVGFGMVPVLLILCGIYGLLFYLLWKKINMPTQQSVDVPLGAFPYGPAICASIFTCVLSEEFVLQIFH